jgi:hypothetical protein
MENGFNSRRLHQKKIAPCYPRGFSLSSFQLNTLSQRVIQLLVFYWSNFGSFANKVADTIIKAAAVNKDAV